MNTATDPAYADLKAQNAEFAQRIAVLELQLSSARTRTRQAYSALLAYDMGAVLEDGTPVLELALDDSPMKDAMIRTFTGGTDGS